MRTRLGVAIALLVTALPALLVPLPPLLDYPNHLARLWLLGGGLADPFLASAYRVAPGATATNLLIDFVAYGLGGAVPLSLLGRALVTGALLLPAIGLLAVAHAAHGRIGAWHVAAVGMVWTRTLLFGFLNFQLALGLALLAAAVDHRLVRRGGGWCWAWRGLAAAVLLVAHAFGLLFFAVLVAGLAIGPGGRIDRRRLARGAWAMVPAVAVALLFWLLAPHPMDARPGPPSPLHWQSAWGVGYGRPLVNALAGYRPWLDLGGALLLFAPLAAGRVRVHAGLALACAGLLVGSLLMPRYAFGTALLDLRLPTMLWLALPTALAPARLVAPRVAVALALALVTTRAAANGLAWHARQADVRALRSVLAALPRHARLLPLMHEPQRMADLPVGRRIGHQITAWHLPALAVVERQAFVPTLFASRGRHLLQVRPAFAPLAVAEGGIPTVDQLGRTLTPEDAHEWGYLTRWRCFSHILVLDADVPNAAGPLPADPRIVPVAHHGFAALYRIRPGGCPR